jgi:N-methylhydantoinase A/oxoprolinase/acetone carboxylase beta subunit
MKRIGIDVGGTNTDAVLISADTIVAGVKATTTEDVLTGVSNSLAALKDKVGGEALTQADAVMIGTTHFTNAVIERKHLNRVAAIRIALPAAASLEPAVDWPADLRASVDPAIFMVEGGHEYDGRPLVPLDEDALRQAARDIAKMGIRSVAITALFSPLTSACETRAAEILAEECPDAAITLSHTLGRIGLLERENVAIMNAALKDLGARTVSAFRDALARAGLHAPFYLTQNDGTVMLAEVAAANPVYSFASGPTNSMRGSSALSGLTDAMVVDVGGTTSDVGVLINGFPREANGVVEIGGVRTLFRMPDLLPFGLGGGTIIDPDTGRIGPQSVGYRLTEQALVFGGDILTATDIAVAAGRIELGDPDRVRHLDRRFVDDIMARIRAMFEERVDRMKTSADDAVLIASGGGAFLVPDELDGISKIVRLEHAGVANAVGAAMAQVSGEVDQVFSGVSRAEALAQAKAGAEARAVEGGADPTTLKTVDVEDIPLSYLPGEARRVHTRVVGDIAAITAAR